jgi:hypothetical protein
MKPSSPVLQSSRLLDQLRECLNCNYYSLNTEKYYVYWVLFFVRWSGRSGTVGGHHQAYACVHLSHVS